MGFEFHERASRDAQMVEELPRMFAALPFGDVGRNGDGGAANLAGEAEPLFLRQSPGRGVTVLRQIHTHRPNLQLAITLQAHHNLLSLTNYHWALNALS